MSFLTPLYLAGLAAIALPILFHLIRRTPRGRMVFSTLMFLKPSPPRLTRRSRLDHWLLLLLRGAALTLLALAFARPFLRTNELADPGHGRGAELAILVDTSASMQRAGLFDRAIEVAYEVLDEHPNDVPCLYTFHERLVDEVGIDVRNALEPDLLRALVVDRIDALRPTWFATDLGGSLVTLADRLDAARARHAERPVRIVVVTDLQTGTRLETLASYDWPHGLDVEVRRVESERGNVNLQRAPAGYGGADEPSSLWVRLTADEAWSGAPLELAWSATDAADARPLTLTVTVPAGQAILVRAPERTEGLPVVRLELRGDEEPFDDVLYALPRTTSTTRVFIGGEDPEGERGLTFFLRKVFEGREGTQVAFPRFEDTPVDDRTDDLVVISWRNDLERLDVDALRAHALSGGTCVVVLADELGEASTGRLQQDLVRLLEVPSLTIQEAAPARGYALLAKIDFAHPVFAPFDQPEYADFTRIRTWHHRAITFAEAEAPHVVARFDDGSPYWIERALGKGRVIVLTSGWHVRDSDLARSSKFAPIVLGLQALGRAPALRESTFHVGDVIPRRAGTWTDPEGRTLTFAAEAPDETRFDKPGIYTLQDDTGVQSLAVQLAPDEGLTDPLDVDTLRSLAVPTTTREHRERTSERRRQETIRELERSQGLWRFALLAALLCLLAETLLARRIERGIDTQTNTSSS